MGRIVLEINVVEDGVHIQPVPYRWVGEGVANTHAHQVARELLKYFQALLKENPDATAVADALSHEQSGIGPITIQQDFTTSNTDPDDFYKEIVKMNASGGPHGNLR